MIRIEVSMIIYMYISIRVMYNALLMYVCIFIVTYITYICYNFINYNYTA